MIEDCISKLNSHGYILFAGEPIYQDWPVPWSIRTDSLSAYCIHKFGWMELGFSEDYFLNLLYSKGLFVESRKYVDHPVANSYLAKQRGQRVPLPNLALPRACEDSWNIPDGSSMRWTKGKGLIPGWMVAGSNIKFEISNHSGTTMAVGVFSDVNCLETASLRSGETIVVGSRVPEDANYVSVFSPSWSPSKVSASTDSRLLGVAVSNIVFVD